MPKKKCIILDIDGVIIYSKNAIFHLYSEILKQQNQEFKREDVQKIYGKTDFESHAVLKSLGYKIPEYSEYRKEVEKLRSNIDSYYELTPIGNVLQHLKTTSKLCIATNRTDESANRILNKFKIKRFFDFVATVSAFNPKPDPSMILHCLKATKTDKKDALFVGDTAIDKLAGERAGVKTMIISLE